jgi:predicted ATPase with chaperone activity
MVGHRGTGKSMLAAGLPAILPRLRAGVVRPPLAAL